MTALQPLIGGSNTLPDGGTADEEGTAARLAASSASSLVSVGRGSTRDPCILERYDYHALEEVYQEPA